MASDYLSRFSPFDFTLTAGVVVSIIGGAIVLIQGIAVLIYGESLSYSIIFNASGAITAGLSVVADGLFALIVGAFMIGGAYLMASNYFKMLGAVIVLIFSVVSIVVGGGWEFGFVLGLCGGVLGLFRR